MTDIVIYSTAACSYCTAAKSFLKARGIEFRELRIDTDPQARSAMMALTTSRTVPQIVINGRLLGGFDDMVALDRAGQFNELLEKNP